MIGDLWLLVIGGLEMGLCLLKSCLNQTSGDDFSACKTKLHACLFDRFEVLRVVMCNLRTNGSPP